MTTKVEARGQEGDLRRAAEVGAEPSEINREAEFEALDVDSLDLVEVAQIVEDQFGVRLEGDDLKGITPVGDVVDLVVTKSG